MCLCGEEVHVIRKYVTLDEGKMKAGKEICTINSVIINSTKIQTQTKQHIQEGQEGEQTPPKKN